MRPFLRIVSSAVPLSRRQLLALAGSGFALLLWPRSAASRPEQGGEAQVPGILALKMPIQNLAVRASSIYSIMEQLRRDYGIPISFIAAAGEFFGHSSLHLNFSVTLPSGTVQDVLDQMVSQHPVYRWRVIESRLVFLPSEPQYQVFLTGIHLHHLPRQEAADKYTIYLKAHVAGFEKLYFVSVGDLHARIFTDRVALPLQGTVVELLVKLLGENPMYVFSIDERVDGVLELCLNEVNPGLIGRSDQKL